MVEKDETLDCLGMICPAPIALLAKKVRKMESGKVLELLVDDIGAVEDVPAWSRRTNNEILEVIEDNNSWKFYIKKS